MHTEPLTLACDIAGRQFTVDLYDEADALHEIDKAHAADPPGSMDRYEDVRRRLTDVHGCPRLSIFWAVEYYETIGTLVQQRIDGLKKKLAMTPG